MMAQMFLLAPSFAIHLFGTEENLADFSPTVNPKRQPASQWMKKPGVVGFFDIADTGFNKSWQPKC